MTHTEVSNHCKTFCVNTFKLLVSPIIRPRKLLRKSNMRQMKVAVGVLIIFSCAATAFLYYWYRLTFTNSYWYNEVIKTTERLIINGTPIKHVPLNEVYKDLEPNGKDNSFEVEDRREAKMVDTEGCKIPVVMLNYEINSNNRTRRTNCGNRAIFLKKIDGHTVQVFIKMSILAKYMKQADNRFECCHQFVVRNVHPPSYPDKIFGYSKCIKFKDNTKILLDTDFIHVKCNEYTVKNETSIFYEDMYAFAKKINTSRESNSTSDCKRKYNVLMIGMDSMSLPRAAQTIPRTIDYFKNDFWINFRGYHKIGDNTLPNIMAALTGMNFSSISKKCVGKMDKCNDLMIWSEFKKLGYITAYGEDFLRLPETFSNEYKFQKPPTDHYMKPFFYKREHRHKNSTFLCTGKACSGQQILNYALDFANTYKKESFFGFFWINSFSHEDKSRPQAADKMIENFFYQMTYTGVLENTFVIFFSDHGIRFGNYRFNVESYYDDRIPMFFMWPPPHFKGKYFLEVRALAINQFRLITPYDLYSTLLDMKRLSMCSNTTQAKPEGCPLCHSIFTIVSSNRTCKDVSISEKWCSCHKLYPLPVQDTEGIKSVDAVVNHINSIVKKIKTTPCFGCLNLSLKNIFRIHFYYDKDKVSLYYVVAFSLTPGNSSYEATVYRRAGEPGIVMDPVSYISGYRGLGECTVKRRERLFCICQKIEKCSSQ